VTEDAVPSSTQGASLLTGAAGTKARWRSRVSPRVLVDLCRMADLGLLATAFLITAWLLPAEGRSGRLLEGAGAALLAAPILSRAAGIARLHDFAVQSRVAAQACLASAGFIVLARLLAGQPPQSSLLFALVWGMVSLSLLLLQRLALERWLDRLTAEGRLAERIAFYGGTPEARRLATAATRDHGSLVEVVGIYDDAPPERVRVTGNARDLIDLSRRERVDIVVITGQDPEKLDMLAGRFAVTVADIAVPLGQSGRYVDTAPIRRLDGLRLAMLEQSPIRDWRAGLKAGFDLASAAILLLLLSPLLLAIAIAIKLDSEGPVFFRQIRRGFNERQFELWKFRTMHHAMRDPNANQLTTRNDPRVTKVGNFLRRTSLDELPQLWNVLRGDMSLVGPRPHPLGAKAANRPYAEVVKGYPQRHRVKPGLTGWAQINGWRGETETEHQILERVRHDIEYIRRWSFLFDLRILVQTAWKGFRSDAAF